MKFGKQIQKRQLEVPEYAASFVNYKALKKLIKKLSATPVLGAQNEYHNGAGPVGPLDSQAALQANKATFFFQLERELEKVNACYLQKEAELKIRLKTLLDKKKVLQSRSHGISRRSAKFATLQEGFQQFANDLNKLQLFVEINGTAFSKILKKWDKTSKSKTKELYLSRAVEVQPFFNATVISELSDQVTTSLQELGAWADGDHVADGFGYQRSDHIVSSQHLLGTAEGDADTLLLDTVRSGNLDSLRDLLGRMRASSPALDGQAAGESPVAPEMDLSLRERITRTFLASINEGLQASLEVLLSTGLVDIQSEDDINERNCLHQATIYGNSFVLQQGLAGGVAVGRTDVYGRVPLHYASMHGRLDMLAALLDADPKTIDMIDHDNFTPLIHAIVHNHMECVRLLVEKSARLNPVSDTDHVPLNLACEHGARAIAELLLAHGARLLPDAEGLYPQHLVARSGQSPDLLLLLKQYGADLNQVDKLYGWTPLLHAASEGNVPCLRALLDVGVDADILDEKDLAAMYYAAWEGHLECMKLLVSHSQRRTTASAAPPTGGGGLPPHLSIAALGSPAVGGSSHAPMAMSLDSDAIPVLELPPPIIPLRRYGHNFLDTKNVVRINFEADNGSGSEQPLVFFHDSKYPAARLTISSKVSDIIPKNIILPFQEDTRLVSFHVDNLDSFTLDFDVFPAYGAKVIAKTVALPSTFRPLLSSSSSRSCCLPLFDPRLRAIGQISFHMQVVKPFSGAPLEIADFETYWKATSQLDGHPSTFVSGSSLSGDFVRLYVQHTSDAVPVLWPLRTVPCGGIDIPVSRLTLSQFTTAVALAFSSSTSPSTVSDGNLGSIRSELASLPSRAPEEIAEVHRILATAGITLHEALQLLPSRMHVNLQIIYPTPDEERTLSLGPSADMNTFVDAVLTVVFDHARAQRANSPDAVRSVVFSSYNPNLCTALNWKQPNFAVFLCNDLGREDMVESEQKSEDKEGAEQAKAGAERGSDGRLAPNSNVVNACGGRSTSIKEVVRIAQSNNLMGVICCSRLLDMVPALIEAIKSQGLALVVDRSGDRPGDLNGLLTSPFPSLPQGVDGLVKDNGVLRFNESIDM